MATLQRIGDTYHIRFRFAGKPYRRSLLVSEEAEALATRNQVELTLHRVTTGTIPPPPPGADVPTYFISGGKQDGKPAVAPQVIPTLKEMWKSYLTSLPTGAKEQSSLNTEKYHFKHLLQILGGTTRVGDITTDALQEYIKERSKQRGFRGNVKPRTIRKEISTFRNVWNNFAVPRQLVDKNFRAAFGKLLYPKDSERPSFQTWEQIERQVARGGLSKNEIASLWDCLFLDLGRIRQFLDHVRQKPGLPGWIYPALVAVAHTGCRRGEFLRSQISDWVKWTPKTGQSNKLLLAVQERGNHGNETEVPPSDVQSAGGVGGGEGRQDGQRVGRHARRASQDDPCLEEAAHRQR